MIREDSSMNVFYLLIFFSKKRDKFTSVLLEILKLKKKNFKSRTLSGISKKNTHEKKNNVNIELMTFDTFDTFYKSVVLIFIDY